MGHSPVRSATTAAEMSSLLPCRAHPPSTRSAGGHVHRMHRTRTLHAPRAPRAPHRRGGHGGTGARGTGHCTTTCAGMTARAHERVCATFTCTAACTHARHADTHARPQARTESWSATTAAKVSSQSPCRAQTPPTCMRATTPAYTHAHTSHTALTYAVLFAALPFANSAFPFRHCHIVFSSTRVRWRALRERGWLEILRVAAC